MSAYLKKLADNQAVATVQFGAFLGPVKGLQTARTYPRMSGNFAAATLAYWRDETLKVARKYGASHNLMTGTFFGIPVDDTGLNSEQSAGFTGWRKNQMALQAYANDVIPSCQAMGDKWISNTSTIRTWNLINATVLGMQGIADDPGASFWDATVETLADYGRASAGLLAKLAKEAVNLTGQGVKGFLEALLPGWFVPVALVAGGVWVYSKIRSRA